VKVNPGVINLGDRPPGKGIGLAAIARSDQGSHFVDLSKIGHNGQMLMQELAGHPALKSQGSCL